MRYDECPLGCTSEEQHEAHMKPYSTEAAFAAAAPPAAGDVAPNAVPLEFPAGLHPATQNLVHLFAEALGRKLFAAQQKYGYSDGWRSKGWTEECRAKLREHVAKGDPRDVAAYCAFLWHHGESTATAGDEASDRTVFASDDDKAAFTTFWRTAPHRAKYPTDHPAYLAAREAWHAALAYARTAAGDEGAIEAIAQLLWNRFAGEYEIEWAEAMEPEIYRSAARACILAIRAAALRAAAPAQHASVSAMDAVDGAWGMVSEALDGVKLPESVNEAIYALRDGRARVVMDAAPAQQAGEGDES